MLTLYPITSFKLPGGGTHLIKIALDDVFSTLMFKGGFKTNPEKKCQSLSLFQKTLFQKTLSEEKKKSSSQDRKVMWIVSNPPFAVKPIAPLNWLMICIRRLH